MNMDLYAQLHGLTKAIQKSHAPKSDDSAFERAVNEYTEILVAEEKKIFQSGIESFSQHADKVRTQARAAMEEFYQKYEAGYKAICEVLEAQKAPIPQVTDENLAIFEDGEAFMKAIEDGSSIYELLGFSPETLESFYKALISLFDNQEYQKVRDGFFFLITISPETADFWTGLGIAETKLKEYEKANEAFLHALDLDPASKDAYLGCLHIYAVTNRLDEAENLCDQGIAYAQLHRDDPLTEELELILIEAKSVLKT